MNRQELLHLFETMLCGDFLLPEGRRIGGGGDEAVAAGWHRVGQEEGGNLARSHRGFEGSTRRACCSCRMKEELFLRDYGGRRQTYVVLGSAAVQSVTSWRSVALSSSTLIAASACLTLYSFHGLLIACNDQSDTEMLKLALRQFATVLCTLWGSSQLSLGSHWVCKPNASVHCSLVSRIFSNVSITREVKYDENFKRLMPRGS